MLPRPATADDLLGVQIVVMRAFAGYVPRMLRRPAPMSADYAAYIKARQVHVLEDGEGTICGVVVLDAFDDHLHVDVLAVHPDHQGDGMGRRLMAFAEDQARRLGLPEVKLHTNALMTENLVFYPSLGFEEIGRQAVKGGFERVHFGKRLGGTSRA